MDDTTSRERGASFLDECAMPPRGRTLPLPTERPPVKPFPPEILPESLRPWIEDIAERLQCPPEFPAVGAMESLAALVGRKVGIRPRHDDWLVVPNLWGVIVGRPGVLKPRPCKRP